MTAMHTVYKLLCACPEVLSHKCPAVLLLLNLFKAKILLLLFTVYKDIPWHLEQQRQEAIAYAKAHPQACPSDIAVQ